MNHLSLFSGIGGLDLAAEWAGFTTVAFVERDPYCQRVLAKRWPGVPILADVRDVAHAEEPRRVEPENEADARPDGRRGGHGSLRRGEVCLVSGGFPCQPHSVAGKRQASADDRDLWPEFARVIREIRPRWVVAENVPGLLHSESGRFFGAVLGDLADMGYSAGWGVWGAADVGALHRRERVFIVAHAAWDVQPERQESGAEWQRARAGSESVDVADAGRSRLEERAVLAGVSGQAQRGDSRQDAALGREAVPDADRGRLEERAELDSDQAQDAADWRSRWEHADRHRSAPGWELEPDVGRVAGRLPAGLDGGGLNEEEHDQEARAAGIPASYGEVRVMWDAWPDRATPSELRRAGSLRDALSTLSHQGGSAGRHQTGPSAEELQALREALYPGAQHEAQLLQPGMSFRDWENQCREAMDPWRQEPPVPRVAQGVKNHVQRLRALGNCVVPQQAYPLFAEIARLERAMKQQYAGYNCEPKG